MCAPRWAVASTVLSLALPAAAVAVAPASLRFETVFGTRHEPAFLHYTVRYVSNGAGHSMTVWRDHDHRVKRVTDAAIKSYATHRPGAAGYRLTLLDVRRRISTRIDRTNMYRIGGFTDWYDLAHGLRHPKGDYRLARRTVSPRMPAPLRPCQWYDLEEAGQVSHICWDTSARIPLLIATGDRLVWRVMALDVKPIAALQFKPTDNGFTRNDANRDIERD